MTGKLRHDSHHGIILPIVERLRIIIKSNIQNGHLDFKKWHVEKLRKLLFSISVELATFVQLSFSVSSQGFA